MNVREKRPASRATGRAEENVKCPGVSLEIVHGLKTLVALGLKHIEVPWHIGSLT